MTQRLEQLLSFHEADPNDPFCSYGIALEHIKAGRGDEAIHWLDKTLGIDPQYCYAFYQKAKLLAQQADTAAASQVLQDGMRIAKQAGDDHALSEMAELLESFVEGG